MSDIFVHPTASVSDKATIGEGTKIWHHCQVREDAHIGANCILGKGVYIDKEVVVGNECKIQNYACLYQGVVVGDRVFIGPHVTFTNDMYPRSFLWNKERLKRTEVKEGASIGANATVLCGITIGKYAMVGAGTVVTKHVPAHRQIAGNPGVVKGYCCVCGHPLGEDEPLVCSECGRILKVK